MADSEELPIDDIAADIRSAVETNGKALAEKISSTDIPQETEAQKTERQRNERGQFVAAEAQTATAAPITDADPAQAAIVQPSTAVDMPKTWSAEAKAEWSKLPPAVQQAISRREAEMDNGGRQWSEQRRQFEQALGPVNQLSQQYQMPIPDVVNRLVNVEQQLANPQRAPQIVAELLKAYNVDLQQVNALLANPQQSQQQFDPSVIPQMFQQEMQKWEADRALNSEIQTFATERDPAGQLKHPHFTNEAVKQHMSALLDKGLATGLQDAYEKAIWAIPDTRTTIQRPVNTDKARRAAVSPRGAPNGTAPAKGNQYPAETSVVDDIRESIASLRH